MRAVLAVAALLITGSAATGCGNGSGAAAGNPVGDAAATTPAGRLVLVSGRDDHGMVAEEHVLVYDEPEGRRVTGEVDDGTLARVLGTDGQWLHVETVEGGHAVRGWVDDFFLRGVSRLVGPAPSCEATLAGERRTGGTQVIVRDLRRGRVKVEMVSEPATTGWVSRDVLQELPPQGERCGDIPPEDRHSHAH